MPSFSLPRRYTGNYRLMVMLRPSIGTYFENTDDGKVYQWNGFKWQTYHGVILPRSLTPDIGSGLGGGSMVIGPGIPAGGFLNPIVSPPPVNPGPGGQEPGSQKPGPYPGGGNGPPSGVVPPPWIPQPGWEWAVNPCTLVAEARPFTIYSVYTGAIDIAGPNPPARGFLLGAVTVPDCGTLTLLDYTWTEYGVLPGDAVALWAWIEDASGNPPPGFGWLPSTTLGANLGDRLGLNLQGNCFNIEAAGGNTQMPIPDTGYAVAGMKVTNTTGLPVVFRMRTGTNPPFAAFGTWSVLARLKVTG